MPTEVIMPALGMAQDTGIVVQWLKRAGDAVTKGEPLFEVETDKAVVEVEAPATGTLAAITASEGVNVPVGQSIALILGEGESAPQEPPERPLATQALGLDSGPPAPAEPADQQSGGAPAQSAAEEPGQARLRPASPAARRRAAESGVDLRSLRGSGPGGAVLAADLPRSGPAIEPAGDTVSRTWQLMAERTTSSWSAPHFYLTREALADRLLSWRATLARRGTSVTHTDLLVKLAAATLKSHPEVNSRWHDGRVVREPEISVGIAVAVPEGLTVPVIRNADGLSLPDIAARREQLLERARARRLSPADLEGGTFTLSNLGMLGVDAFTAVINAGQAAILSVGRIAERPVVQDGRVVAAPTIVLTLGCDHRAIDGARGARFLQDLVAAIEEPAVLLD